MGTQGKVLMLQGTASSVGKSLLTAALCRIFREDGLRVAPFKAQNMSNNAFVTPDGGEIGRAQAVQAEACGIPPRVEMNPVLLKPQAESRSQVVLLGRPLGVYSAREYFALKAKLWESVTASLDALRAEFDIVVIEGAGSPAEINLKARDIVNMRVARYAESPVLLAGDMDRGGVFAHLYGTVQLLEPEERALVKGFIINKFRGDPSLIDPGPAMLEQLTGIPTVGIVPYLRDVHIAEEDSVALERPERNDEIAASPEAGATLDIAVVQLPRIANFDDFDTLRAEPGVRLRYVARSEDIGEPDLIILPGTKSTMADLTWMRERGLDRQIVARAGEGAAVIGICGGYQMLGRRIIDEEGVESETAVMDGLGLLPVGTVFSPVKATNQTRGKVAGSRGLLTGAQGLPVAGYEIHMGQSMASGAGPAFTITERSGHACETDDGTLSADGWVFGTYIHGLFDSATLRATMLQNLAQRKGITIPATLDLDREREYDKLAAAVRSSLEMGRIYQIVGL